MQLRLFAALHVANEHAGQLADLGDAISERVDGLRPVPADQLHVTFAYMGDVVEDYVPAVAAALDAVAADVPGPTACILGAPVVLGAGHALALEVECDLHVLLDAARDVFVETVQAYAPTVDRRPWHPHLTVLRGEEQDAVEQARLALIEHRPTATWVSSEFRLYASLPSPNGRLHKLLHSVPFGHRAIVTTTTT